jgi:hypothetical protein
VSAGNRATDVRETRRRFVVSRGVDSGDRFVEEGTRSYFSYFEGEKGGRIRETQESARCGYRTYAVCFNSTSSHFRGSRLRFRKEGLRESEREGKGKREKKGLVSNDNGEVGRVQSAGGS